MSRSRDACVALDYVIGAVQKEFNDVAEDAVMITDSFRDVFRKPPVREFEYLFHRKFSEDEVIVSLFHPKEEQFTYFPKILQASSQPSVIPLANLRSLVLSLIFLVHRKIWSFMEQFILNGGLLALAEMVNDGNLYIQEYALEICLSIVNGQSFDWFHPIEDGNISQLRLHKHLLALATETNFLQNLVANRTGSFAGGSYCALQILAFWLSWLREMYTEDQKLALPTAVLNELKHWSIPKDDADEEQDPEELQLAKELYEDFKYTQFHLKRGNSDDALSSYKFNSSVEHESESYSLVGLKTLADPPLDGNSVSSAGTAFFDKPVQFSANQLSSSSAKLLQMGGYLDLSKARKYQAEENEEDEHQHHVQQEDSYADDSANYDDEQHYDSYSEHDDDGGSHSHTRDSGLAEDTASQPTKSPRASGVRKSNNNNNQDDHSAPANDEYTNEDEYYPDDDFEEPIAIVHKAASSHLTSGAAALEGEGSTHLSVNNDEEDVQLNTYYIYDGKTAPPQIDDSLRESYEEYKDDFAPPSKEDDEEAAQGQEDNETVLNKLSEKAKYQVDGANSARSKESRGGVPHTPTASAPAEGMSAKSEAKSALDDEDEDLLAMLVQHSTPPLKAASKEASLELKTGVNLENSTDYYEDDFAHESVEGVDNHEELANKIQDIRATASHAAAQSAIVGALTKISFSAAAANPSPSPVASPSHASSLVNAMLSVAVANTSSKNHAMEKNGSISAGPSYADDFANDDYSSVGPSTSKSLHGSEPPSKAVAHQKSVSAEPSYADDFSNAEKSHSSEGRKTTDESAAMAKSEASSRKNSVDKKASVSAGPSYADDFSHEQKSTARSHTSIGKEDAIVKSRSNSVRGSAASAEPSYADDFSHEQKSIASSHASKGKSGGSVAKSGTQSLHESVAEKSASAEPSYADDFTHDHESVAAGSTVLKEESVVKSRSNPSAHASVTEKSVTDNQSLGDLNHEEALAAVWNAIGKVDGEGSTASRTPSVHDKVSAAPSYANDFHQHSAQASVTGQEKSGSKVSYAADFDNHEESIAAESLKQESKSKPIAGSLNEAVGEGSVSATHSYAEDFVPTSVASALVDGEVVHSALRLENSVSAGPSYVDDFAAEDVEPEEAVVKGGSVEGSRPPSDLKESVHSAHSQVVRPEGSLQKPSLHESVAKEKVVSAAQSYADDFVSNQPGPEVVETQDNIVVKEESKVEYEDDFAGAEEPPTPLSKEMSVEGHSKQKNLTVVVSGAEEDMNDLYGELSPTNHEVLNKQVGGTAPSETKADASAAPPSSAAAHAFLKANFVSPRSEVQTESASSSDKPAELTVTRSSANLFMNDVYKSVSPTRSKSQATFDFPETVTAEIEPETVDEPPPVTSTATLARSLSMHAILTNVMPAAIENASNSPVHKKPVPTVEAKPAEVVTNPAPKAAATKFSLDSLQRYDPAMSRKPTANNNAPKPPPNMSAPPDAYKPKPSVPKASEVMYKPKPGLPPRPQSHNNAVSSTSKKSSQLRSVVDSNRAASAGNRPVSAAPLKSSKSEGTFLTSVPQQPTITKRDLLRSKSANQAISSTTKPLNEVFIAEPTTTIYLPSKHVPSRRISVHLFKSNMESEIKLTKYCAHRLPFASCKVLVCHVASEQFKWVNLIRHKAQVAFDLIAKADLQWREKINDSLEENIEQMKLAQEEELEKLKKKLRVPNSNQHILFESWRYFKSIESDLLSTDPRRQQEAFRVSGGLTVEHYEFVKHQVELCRRENYIRVRNAVNKMKNDHRLELEELKTTIAAPMRYLDTLMDSQVDALHLAVTKVEGCFKHSIIVAAESKLKFQPPQGKDLYLNIDDHPLEVKNQRLFEAQVKRSALKGFHVLKISLKSIAKICRELRKIYGGGNLVYAEGNQQQVFQKPQPAESVDKKSLRPQSALPASGKDGETKKLKVKKKKKRPTTAPSNRAKPMTSDSENDLNQPSVTYGDDFEDNHSGSRSQRTSSKKGSKVLGSGGDEVEEDVNEDIQEEENEEEDEVAEDSIVEEKNPPKLKGLKIEEDDDSCVIYEDPDEGDADDVIERAIRASFYKTGGGGGGGGGAVEHSSKPPKAGRPRNDSSSLGEIVDDLTLGSSKRADVPKSHSNSIIEDDIESHTGGIAIDEVLEGSVVLEKNVNDIIAEVTHMLSDPQYADDDDFEKNLDSADEQGIKGPVLKDSGISEGEDAQSGKKKEKSKKRKKRSLRSRIEALVSQDPLNLTDCKDSKINQKLILQELILHHRKKSSKKSKKQDELTERQHYLQTIGVLSRDGTIDESDPEHNPEPAPPVKTDITKPPLEDWNDNVCFFCKENFRGVGRLLPATLQPGDDQKLKKRVAARLAEDLTIEAQQAKTRTVLPGATYRARYRESILAQQNELLDGDKPVDSNRIFCSWKCMKRWATIGCPHQYKYERGMLVDLAAGFIVDV